MAKNLRSLRPFLASEAKRVENAANERVIRASMAMVVVLVRNTPVDTSKALSNWVVGLEKVDPSYIGPWVPGVAGSTRQTSGDAAIIMAHLILRDKRPGVPVFISNAAPYIVRLNSGDHSAQPGGFVARAMIVGRAEIRKKVSSGRSQ